jgi:hypothetical protein
MLEKKEKYLEAQIDEEQKKAKANANTNKAREWISSRCSSPGGGGGNDGHQS